MFSRDLLARVTDLDPALEMSTVNGVITVVDGFKIESITVRNTNSSKRPQIFIGTDDENYGGTLRQLAP